MSMIINDELIEARLLEERRAKGLDGHDEVWDGVYVMSPLANNEHQRLTSELVVALHGIVSAKGLGRIYPGAIVSDRDVDWTKNYRVPDVLVFLNGTTAEDRDTHWFGGPDFAIEIVSPGDRSLEKLDFYATVNTRELLVIDRKPWRLTLYARGSNEAMQPVAVSGLDRESIVESTVISAQFALVQSVPCLRIVDPNDSVTREFRINL
jgi:Uma2 family endonuclease